MSVFLTGATGFVGANLAIRLLEQGEEVHILARPSSRLWRLKDVPKSLHVHDADLLNADALAALLETIRPESVFHLAAYGAYAHQNEARNILETTIMGTLNLLQASKKAGVGMVINTGSSSEYGTKDHRMKEDERIEPNSYYAVGKSGQTLLCQQFAREEKLPVITLRLFSVYGPFEEPSRLVPTLIQKALSGADLPLARPETARDFIYVDDVVNAYLKAAQHPELSGEVFNIGTGKQSTLEDIVGNVLKITGSASKPLWGAYPSRPFDTSVWIADVQKSSDLLGFQASTTLEAGLGKHIEWFKAHQEAYAV